MSNRVTKQESAVVWVVDGVEQMFFPHDVNWHGRSELLVLPVIHDRLEFHELSVSLEAPLRKGELPAILSHAAIDERGRR